jgi:hypothetical protein
VRGEEGKDLRFGLGEEVRRGEDLRFYFGDKMLKSSLLLAS